VVCFKLCTICGLDFGWQLRSGKGARPRRLSRGSRGLNTGWPNQVFCIRPFHSDCEDGRTGDDAQNIKLSMSSAIHAVPPLFWARSQRDRQPSVTRQIWGPNMFRARNPCAVNVKSVIRPFNSLWSKAQASSPSIILPGPLGPLRPRDCGRLNTPPDWSVRPLWRGKCQRLCRRLQAQAVQMLGCWTRVSRDVALRPHMFAPEARDNSRTEALAAYNSRNRQ